MAAPHVPSADSGELAERATVPQETFLIVGMGVSGDAVARHLRQRGGRVLAVDDSPTDRARGRAADAGVDLVEAPDPERLRALVAEADVVVPSPGVPEAHPVFRLAAALGRPVRGEIELASRWARHPLAAITGTNGKTTVTELVTAMLDASGRRALAAGNIGLALSDAVRCDVDVIVVEVSSFQLQFTDTFRPAVATWLNFAPDHLDWHRDLDAYAAAKAQVWAHQGDDDVAVANADDPVVMAWASARTTGARLVTFGLGPHASADYRVADGALLGPEGELLRIDELPRTLPHDLANGLAAAAVALAAGATVDGVASGLRRFAGLPHRIVLVAEADGVSWYDDSKATNPHAAAAAVAGFGSVVLIAGGRNKGLDLSPLAATAERVRAVVALGEAGPQVAAAFAGVRPVVAAASMADAVRAAASLAQSGDVVLLSPACASFDQYTSYAQRGDDFDRLVRELVAGR